MAIDVRAPRTLHKDDPDFPRAGKLFPALTGIEQSDDGTVDTTDAIRKDLDMVMTITLAAFSTPIKRKEILSCLMNDQERLHSVLSSSFFYEVMDANLLRMFLDEASPKVRMAIAAHPRSVGKIYDILVNDPDVSVRSVLARHCDENSVLEVMCENERDDDVRRALLTNPHIRGYNFSVSL